MTAPDGSERTTVLLALDGSPAAATALPVARAVAAQLGAGVEILHVSSGPDSSRHERLYREREEPDGMELRVILNEEPAPAILRAADDPAVTLVVLTTHGRIVEPGRSLGRVAEKVIAGAARPILLVRPEAAAESGGHIAGLKRLLAPVDGSPATAVALRSVANLAVQLGASMDLLYVAGPASVPAQEPGSIGAPRYVDQPQHEWPHWAGEVIARVGGYANWPANVPMRMYLALGEAGPEVVRFAAAHGEDAIVLVRRSRLEPGRAAVLRAVLDRAPCPVLLVGGLPV